MSSSRNGLRRGRVRNGAGHTEAPPSPPSPQGSNTGKPAARTEFLLSIVVVLVLVALSASWTIFGGQLSGLIDRTAGTKGAQPAPPIRPPLLFGTNVALYDSKDQFLNSPASQRLLKEANVPIIRMPFRSPRGDIDEIRALRAIQYIGAIPLVIVHGPADANALSDDRQLIHLVLNIFGTSLVYVEFGNEPDLAGVDAQAYAASWNAVIPELKTLAPTYRFIGPSTSTANPAYFATFDRLAEPRPDANTWHEYACTPDETDQDCMARLASWTAHIQQVNEAVRTAIGTTLPLIITEWNLDASVDPRLSNANFMRAWTESALQTLTDNASNGLVGAMQYCVASNPQFNLIDSTDSLTPEGQAFFQVLAQVTSRPVSHR